MRRVAIVLGASILVWLAPRPANAQAKQGDSEVLIGGNLFALIGSGSTNTTGQFQFGYGYFFTDRLEINVTPVVSVSSSQTASVNGSATSNVTGDLGLGGAVQYFFGAKASKVKPYVGGSLVVQSFKTHDQINPVTFVTTSGSISDNLYVGGNAGLKNYFTDRAALDIKASYGVNPKHAGDFQLLQVIVGITYLF